MMTWYQILLCFLSNGIRFFLCIHLVGALLKFPRSKKIPLLLSFGCAAITTVFSSFSLSQMYVLGIEIILLLLITRYLFQRETRMCLFIIFFYEIAVALWDFLISAGLGILLQSSRFIDEGTMEYRMAVLAVRLIMVIIAVILYRQVTLSDNGVFRFTSAVAILGMFGEITLSEQSTLELSDDILTTWLILSMILMMAVLVFYLSRQYEMEKEIVKLKEEHAQLLERDYQMLNNSYSVNAKLFHDLHNHIDILHRLLSQGQADQALHYLEEIHTPVEEIAQTVWTGDEAADYLINSKIALAQQHNIQTKVNIEFPRHTNIRSADLTAILGNLLDNALDATLKTKNTTHFINVTIRRIHDMLIIKVENDCEKISIRNNEELQTTKTVGGLHGWGLKSARAAAERYEGTIETSCENHLFCAVATLSYETRE